VLALLAIVVMINLGFWQLRRLDERRDANALITARSTQTPVPVDAALANDARLDDLRYRAVSASGTYDASRSHVIASRTQDGGPGGWVVTPMKVGGNDVLVLRGFERLEPDGSLATASPPAGNVTVTGYAMVVNRFDNIARQDLEGLRDDRTLPIVVQLKTSAPGDDPELAPVPLPALDEGPHLSYAVQWFLFSAVGAVGYMLVLRREAARSG
jgi:cytochrome oxidase assembly protein ShyY1